MPAKGYLSLSQKKKLQLAIQTEEDAKIRERILMLLLLNKGELIINWSRKLKNKGNAINVI